MTRSASSANIQTEIGGDAGRHGSRGKLSLDEIDHVADTLAFTIDQMAHIDEAYLSAFPDRG